MAFNPNAPGTPEEQALDAQASVLMKRGLRLVEEQRRGAILDALECFNQALAMRRRLPIQSIPIFRYGLAACHLNRGDALVRLSEPAQLPVARHAYDEGIQLLHDLPFEQDARFSRRLAIALQNRGLVILSEGTLPIDEAVAAFEQTTLVLEHEHAAPITDRRVLLATVYVNLAKALVMQDSDAGRIRARRSALQAVSLIGGEERTNADAAEISLNARHVLCQTIAARLSGPASNDGELTMPEDVHEATDAVDDGLALIRQWEQRDVARFRGVALDLFRFGARVYQRYQPQFLAEFIADNSDPAQSSDDYVNDLNIQAAIEEALRLS